MARSISEHIAMVRAHVEIAKENEETDHKNVLAHRAQIENGIDELCTAVLAVVRHHAALNRKLDKFIEEGKHDS